MNNIFELKRFAKVLKSDISHYWMQSWMRFLSVLAIIPFVGFITSNADEGERVSFYLFIALTFALFTHFHIYGGVNNKKGGIDYVMLPATSLEKFVAMILLSAIVSPLLLLSAIFIVDTVMVALPIRYYSDNYISFDILFNDSNMESCAAYLVSMTIFIYGNLLFKKSKVAKTIMTIVAAVILVGSVGSVVTYNVAKSEIEKMQVMDDSVDQNVSVNIINKTYYVDDYEEDIFDAKYGWVIDLMRVLFYGALPATMLTLSYFRIRRMQI